MKTLLSLTIVLAMLTSAAFAADPMEGFAKTYAEAQKTAKATGKPMYLHFTTTWCGWCRRIENDVYAKDEGKKALADFVPATLDCTVERGKAPEGETKVNIDLMQKLGGGGYPFLAILTPEGDLLHSWAGYAPMPQFKEELKKALNNYKQYKEFVAYAAKADKSTYEYNAKALEIYSKLMRIDQAVAAAMLVRKLDPENKNGDAPLASLVLLRATLAEKGQTKDALVELKKFDGANEKGLLEQGYWEAAVASLNAGQMDRGVELLNELAASAKKLAQGQQIYGTLAMVYARQKKFDDAIKAVDKGIALDPKSPANERLKQLKQQIESDQENK